MYRKLRIVALLLVILSTGAGLFAGATGAFAAEPSGGVPPTSLGYCPDDPPNVGGWQVRDFVSHASSSTDPRPYRLRNARLHEPCLDDFYGGYPEAIIALPITLTDPEVDMLDEDEDGEDDGPGDEPGGGTSGEPWDQLCNGTGTLCIQLVASLDFRLTFSGTNRDSGKLLCFDRQVGGSWPAGNAFWAEFPEYTYPPYALPDAGWSPFAGERHLGSPAGSVTGVAWGTGTSVGSGGQWLPNPLACPAGTDHWLRYTINGSGSAEYPPYPPLPSSIGLSTSTTVPPGSWVENPDLVDEGFGIYGGTQASEFIFAASPAVTGQEPSAVYCSSSYTGSASIVRELQEHDGEPYGQHEEPPIIVDGVATDWSFKMTTELGDAVEFTIADCPFLQRIDYWVCAWSVQGPDTYGCTLTQWLSDRWRDHRAYGPDESGPPLQSLCTRFPDTPGCYDVLNPPYVDGTDFDTVCADPPAATWAVFDWLPAFIGHYAECLFVPVNGFDRGGWVSSAWEQSTGGALSETVVSIAAGFNWSGVGCGNVAIEGEGVFEGFAMDTCAWSSWAPDVRTVLWWIVLIGAAVFVVTYVVRLISGLIDKKSPPPTDEAVA